MNRHVLTKLIASGVGLAMGATLLAGASARASDFVFLQQSREVRAGATTNWWGGGTPFEHQSGAVSAPGFGPFDEAYSAWTSQSSATAMQYSTFGVYQPIYGRKFEFRGSVSAGGARSDFYDAWSDASTSLDARFEVTPAIAGDEWWMSVIFPGPDGRVVLTRYDTMLDEPGTPVVESSTTFTPESTNHFAFVRLAIPDPLELPRVSTQYRLQINMGVNSPNFWPDPGMGMVSGEMRVSMGIPGPGAIASAGLGLALVAGRRRR